MEARSSIYDTFIWNINIKISSVHIYHMLTGSIQNIYIDRVILEPSGHSIQAFQ